VPGIHLEIKNNHGTPFKITGIDNELPDHIRWFLEEIKPGYIYKLKIEDISKRAGNYTGHLTVRTDRPEKPKLVVIIDGEVTENGTEGRNTLHGHNLRFSIVQ